MTGGSGSLADAKQLLVVGDGVGTRDSEDPDANRVLISPPRSPA
jgi:hypothetical protein